MEETLTAKYVTGPFYSTEPSCFSAESQFECPPLAVRELVLSRCPASSCTDF
jgi:hypothetical protein